LLGHFGNATVRLTLDDLPAHAQLTVSFDPFTIRSWDGNLTNNGPDVWSLGVRDGPLLLNTTFSHEAPILQAYPDTCPGGSHPGRTGASETDTLCYGLNAVYSLTIRSTTRAPH
jgi:hypothetical protein